jgi:Mn2+/Fe2+ NRAMP family transporter
MTPTRDPYVLDPSLVADPPASLWARLKLLGPGLVLTASIVGSGELIATTRLGAEAGYVLLWLILISCVVKVALQLQFGRHTIQTGETALTAFNKLPGPKFGGVNWSIWCWILIQPVKVIQVGGIIGATAMVLHTAFSPIPVNWWCWILAASVALLVSSEGYGFIERACIALVTAFTATTLVAVVSLQWTDYAVSATQLAEGFQFQMPPGKAVLITALGAFGLTGVGGDEIMQYTYWLIEKGYASKTGPRVADDPAWERRAKGWIGVMYLDAFVSMLVYTVITAAFYVLGAAVLHARGTVPGPNEIVPTLSRMYTDSLGGWAHGVFLLGAFVVLYSTLFSALASWTRTISDALSKLGVINFADPNSRRRAIVTLAWVIPLVWAVAYLLHGRPVDMVILGGIATVAILLLVVVASIDFRYRRTAKELTPGRLYDASLWISIVAMLVLAAYTAYTAMTALEKVG